MHHVKKRSFVEHWKDSDSKVVSGERNSFSGQLHCASSFPIYIKVIESYGIFKSTIRLKLMCSLVFLHRTKVLNKTKIADLTKKFFSLG